MRRRLWLLVRPYVLGDLVMVYRRTSDGRVVPVATTRERRRPWGVR